MHIHERTITIRTFWRPKDQQHMFNYDLERLSNWMWSSKLKVKCLQNPGAYGL